MTTTTLAAWTQPGPGGVEVVVGPALTGRLLAFLARESQRLRREGVVLADDVLELLEALRSASAANARNRAGAGSGSGTVFGEKGPAGATCSAMETAARLGISPRYARLLGRRGEFPGARCAGQWMIPVAAVEAYLLRKGTR